MRTLAKSHLSGENPYIYTKDNPLEIGAKAEILIDMFDNNDTAMCNWLFFLSMYLSLVCMNAAIQRVDSSLTVNLTVVDVRKRHGCN